MSADFERFWNACPKKTGRLNAAKLFAIAVEAAAGSPQKLDSETVEDFLVRRMSDYAASVASRESRYVLHPSTWLKGGRWDDELGFRVATEDALNDAALNYAVLRPEKTRATKTPATWQSVSDKDKAMVYLRASIEALDVKLQKNVDWNRCKNALERMISNSNYHADWFWLPCLPYEEYLKTSHWVNTRRKALETSRFACRVCNASDVELHVHHRTYQNLGCERDEDLIVLCKDCHYLFHEHGRLSTP